MLDWMEVSVKGRRHLKNEVSSAPTSVFFLRFQTKGFLRVKKKNNYCFFHKLVVPLLQLGFSYLQALYINPASKKNSEKKNMQTETQICKIIFGGLSIDDIINIIKKLLIRFLHMFSKIT